MKNFNKFGALLLFVATLAGIGPISAQTVTDPVTVRVPPSTGTQSTTNTSRSSAAHWMKAQVIHADSVSIIVNEIGNQKLVHTFTYSLALKPEMQRILNAGGFHYGDQVKILYEPNSTVALKIHGKPSKTS